MSTALRLGLSILVAIVCAVVDVAAQSLAITNARIIVGNGQVIEQGAVVVRNGRIASVTAGAAGTQSGPAIDARGMTVMAGFIDAHRHIINGDPDRWMRDEAAARMQEFLESGYTTLMSGGGPVPGIVQLKEKIDRGEIKGPRIITSGRADPANFPTPEKARAQVQLLAKAGVEIVKAAISPAAVPDETAILAVVAEESRRQKLDLMVHAVSPKAMLAAVKAGATKLV
ncbi:MAG: amidohydrolase family protein, partial [Acidobacteria bacterium]|nr:amidohydrolase family protein [Acidobacteriota bacterium]